MQKIGIVIPAYNEEKRIGPTLAEYISFFDALKHSRLLDYVLIPVLNNCKDNTRGVVDAYANPNMQILDFEKGGKGFAVIEGFKEALKHDCTHIGFVDADNSTRANEFYNVFLAQEKYDGVLASRYLPGARVFPKQSLQRMFASRIYNLLIRSVLMMPYRDTQCGAKIFSRKAVESIVNEIGMTQWAFDVEILHRLRQKGFILREVPTVWSDAEYSTINFLASGPWMALGIVRLRILHSPLRFFVSYYDRITNFARSVLIK